MGLGAGRVGRAGEVLAVVGGTEEFRRLTQMRRSDVLPPPGPRIAIGMSGTMTLVPM